MTRAIEAAGFADAWRSVHRDPAADPGLTWPAARPSTGGYEPPPGTPHDRIDLLFAGGGARVADCRLAGEAGRGDVAWTVDPWPSDHRAVVADLEVTPMPLGQVQGSWLPAGWIRRTSPDAASTGVTLSRSTVRAGEPIEVGWSGGPAYRWDWIAVVPAAEFAAQGHPQLVDRHVLWAHTGARTSGSLVLDAGAAVVDQSPAGGRWPLSPGEYVVAYLLDDGPRVLGHARLRITP